VKADAGGGGGRAPTACTVPGGYSCRPGCETLCEQTNEQSGCTACPDCAAECCGTTPASPGVTCGGSVCEANLDADDANCGACGNACQSPQKCAGGQCVCLFPKGFLCGSSCVQSNCLCEAAACAADSACSSCIHSKVSAPVGTTVAPCQPDEALTKFSSCVNAKCPNACGVTLP
jgi:hypothetical protein